MTKIKLKPYCTCDSCSCRKCRKPFEYWTKEPFADVLSLKRFKGKRNKILCEDCYNEESKT